MIKNLKNKKIIFSFLVLLSFAAGVFFNPLVGLLGLLTIWIILNPLRNTGLYMKLISSYLIIASVLIFSGFILYFLNLKFTTTIDLFIISLVNLAFLFIKKDSTNDFKIKKLFPKQDVIGLAVLLFVIISMGGFLLSQNNLKDRITQAARGNDSISHLSMDNEISYLGKYIFTLNDSKKIKYNFQGESPYPEGFHYLTAQSYLFIGKNVGFSDQVYRKVNLFNWFNLFNLGVVVSLIFYLIASFIKSRNKLILICSLSIATFFYSEYLQTLMLTGFYNAYFEIGLILFLIYLYYDLIKNGSSNLNLSLIGIVTFACSYAYTFYLPIVLLLPLFVFGINKIKNIYNEFRLGSFIFGFFITASAAVFLYVLNGNGVKVVNAGGGVVSIGYSFTAALVLISFWFLRNKEQAEYKILKYALLSALIWSLILFVYQFITQGTVSYYLQKELYAPVTIAVIISSMAFSEFLIKLRSDTHKIKFMYILFSIFSIYLLLWSFNSQENNYFDITSFNFKYINVPRALNIKLNGINISNKTAYDISAWVKDGSKDNIAFIENCGSSDTLMSNRIAMALTMRGNWAMNILEFDSTSVYGANYLKNNNYIQKINDGLSKGYSALILAGPDQAKLLNSNLKYNQTIETTNYTTCGNF